MKLKKHIMKNSKIYSPISFEEAKLNIGKPCKKGHVKNPNKWKADRSTKNRAKRLRKFKSGKYINTIKGVITHPILKIPAYTFVEDDSYVECRRCTILENFEENVNNFASKVFEKENGRDPNLNNSNDMNIMLILKMGIKYTRLRYE